MAKLRRPAVNLILRELDKLSLALDYLDESQAYRVITIINKKVDALLSPHIIDIVWKQEAQDGVALAPVNSVNIDRTDRGGAQLFFIPTAAATQTGIWAWVYEQGKPVWIEGIKSMPGKVSDLYRTLDGPARNVATGDQIESRYLNIFRDTDSILAVPLITKGAVRGAYSVELPVSGRLSHERADWIVGLAKHVARILWKKETLKHNLGHTSRAISLFGEVIEAQEPPALSPYRQGFVSRPFRQEFGGVEELLRGFLERKRVRAEHYRQRPNGEYVVDDLMNSIRSSHFGLADITATTRT